MAKRHAPATWTEKNVSVIGSVLDCGGPYGRFAHIVCEAREGAYVAVVVLGDLDLARPLHVEPGEVADKIWYIPGNHGSDADAVWRAEAHQARGRGKVPAVVVKSSNEEMSWAVSGRGSIGTRSRGPTASRPKPRACGWSAPPPTLVPGTAFRCGPWTLSLFRSNVMLGSAATAPAHRSWQLGEIYIKIWEQ